ncbi:hypothetical protein U876_07590 [Aeromonas hydrophila NJ-35]|nr:hypothetical protein V428_15495 [Aeromonas hydrophila subsp. hydrophila AL09-71]AHX70218.1 hypothetical protein V429_15525 [Aeromonas hydrophila pc104A]AJE38591.1 hypothetical protein V469_07620 [Aeromonas hydrophila J-1]AKJ37006.1 hypothetical protein U876_07590 [Aeromonas hydrophila NJ-35]ANR99491.1 hypothetical protein A9258_07580 [Aeromonas hydrophila]
MLYCIFYPSCQIILDIVISIVVVGFINQWCNYFIATLESEFIEWISSFLVISITRAIKSMDINTHYGLPLAPGSFNLVLNPRSISCLAPDKHNQAGFTFYIFVDPVLNPLFRTLNLLPSISTNRFITFQQTHVADLLHSHNIIIKMKTVENLPFHI